MDATENVLAPVCFLRFEQVYLRGSLGSALARSGHATLPPRETGISLVPVLVAEWHVPQSSRDPRGPTDRRSTLSSQHRRSTLSNCAGKPQRAPAAAVSLHATRTR
eukprot:651902-Prymnesium_polylepis.1